MCSATVLDRIDGARVGVFAWVRRDGSPTACAVTPFVVAGRPVVTSTLALPTKAVAVRRDPRVALLAAGALVVGTATVEADLTSSYYDAHLRRGELHKYPPSKSLVAIPGHRCLFPWYVGRIVITIEVHRAVLVDEPVADTDCVIGFDHLGELTIAPIGDLPSGGSAARLGAVTAGWIDGPATLLHHHEDAAMTDLFQRRSHGRLQAGTFTTESTATSHDRAGGTGAQVGTLLAMRKQARAHRATIESFPRTSGSTMRAAGGSRASTPPPTR
jgi:hypothetical protein